MDETQSRPQERLEELGAGLTQTKPCERWKTDCSAWKPISRIGSESKTRTTTFLPLYRMTWSSSEKKARSSLMTLRPVTRE